MKLVLVQCARLLAALLGLYVVALGTSLWLLPPVVVGDRLDTARAASSLFATEPKYLFLARSRLDSEADKVLLLGASNAMIGFKQEQVEPLLPKVEVHNISVGGSNITQIGQIVDLVREVQSPAARQHDTYVLGLWYGLFADDKARWYTPDRHPGDTDIDIERYRYGFERRTERGPVPVLPAKDLAAGVLLIHPYLLLDRTTRDLTESFRALISAKQPAKTDEERNSVALNAPQKSQYLAFWREYMGFADRMSESPFTQLSRIIDGILADGGRVLVVDMPIPDWHSKGSPLWADYRRHIDPMLSQLQTRERASVLRMGDENADADFEDEVHPKPRVAPRWAQRLASALNAGEKLKRAQAVNDVNAGSL